MRKGVRNLYRKYLALLTDRGVTTSEVCDATGIKESAMSMWKSRWLNWEKNKDKSEPVPSLDTIVRLADFFDVSVDYFVKE